MNMIVNIKMNMNIIMNMNTGIDTLSSLILKSASGTNFVIMSPYNQPPYSPSSIPLPYCTVRCRLVPPPPMQQLYVKQKYRRLV
jgi:hypothetical protein